MGKLARQERERQQNNPPRATRVYTDADMKNPQILDLEDRARIAAARDAAPMPAVQVITSSAAPVAQPPAPPVSTDPASAPPQNASLGDVARYYRLQKQLREAAQQISLSPVLASFESVRAADTAASLAASGNIAPLPAEPITVTIPPPPANAPLGDVARYYWKLKRSRERPLAASIPPKPRADLFSESRRRTPASAPLATPSNLAGVRIQRGDTLWRIAEKHLGSGAQWRELARINPELRNPNLLRIGAWCRLPMGVSAVTKIVRAARGNTLSQIARAEYGNSQAWTCVARANPQLRDPNRILPGQILSLPLACSFIP